MSFLAVSASLPRERVGMAMGTNEHNCEAEGQIHWERV